MPFSGSRAANRRTETHQLHPPVPWRKPLPYGWSSSAITHRPKHAYRYPTWTWWILFSSICQLTTNVLGESSSNQIRESAFFIPRKEVSQNTHWVTPFCWRKLSPSPAFSQIVTHSDLGNFPSNFLSLLNVFLEKHGSYLCVEHFVWKASLPFPAKEHIHNCFTL